MDETMLSAKRRLKVLAQKVYLPLIPEQIKLPHLTGCVTISASGHVFDPLIILPRKKTLRTLHHFNGSAYFASSAAGWMTSNIFIYYCLLLVCQVIHYRLTLPNHLRNERILLLVDGHPSRNNFKAALILYLFDIDLVLIPPHTSHLLQPFDVSLASPLKTYFKEELVRDKFVKYFTSGFTNSKDTATELRTSMIKSFLSALRKSATPRNIEAGFEESGIASINREIPLSSQYATNPTNYDKEKLLKSYWLNSEESLKDLFYKENGREIVDNDYDIDFSVILNEIKSASVEDGFALSELPSLFIEDNDSIKRVDF